MYQTCSNFKVGLLPLLIQDLVTAVPRKCFTICVDGARRNHVNETSTFWAGPRPDYPLQYFQLAFVYFLFLHTKDFCHFTNLILSAMDWVAETLPCSNQRH